jgi:WD40 repeat protein
MAIAHNDGALVIYDLAFGKQCKSWHGPGPAQDLGYRPDGKEIAVVYKDNPPTCRILDAETVQQLRVIALDSYGSVAWSPDGTAVAIPGKGSKISVWDAATGQPRVILEGATSSGLGAVFHPSGALLASNGWEGRLRLWDAVLGRQILSLTGGGCRPCSRDGRIFVSQANAESLWRIEPALEYRTLAHPSSPPLNYARPSIRRDGRLLAVGTDKGLVIWDLAHGTELAYLRIGLAWHSMFDVSGDLLTNGQAGFWQWPIQIDPTSGDLRIGPPRRLALPGTTCGIAEDRTGKTLAVAGREAAHVAIGDKIVRIGPLEDCRGVSVSPDGQWLATNNHLSGGTIWKLPDGARVAECTGAFSPNGNWLISEEPCRLYEVGTWHEVRKFDGTFRAFSSDGRTAVILDSSNLLRLIEIETGRILARLESPDLNNDGMAAFSPDCSRLVVATNNPPPCVHVWDLRAIRRQLAGMGLDWDAPAYSEDDPARADLPPFPPVKVDYGPLVGHLEQFSERPELLIECYSTLIKKDPRDAESYHQRSHALLNLNRLAEAIDDLSQGIRLRPGDASSSTNVGGSTLVD